MNSISCTCCEDADLGRGFYEWKPSWMSSASNLPHFVLPLCQSPAKLRSWPLWSPKFNESQRLLLPSSQTIEASTLHSCSQKKKTCQTVGRLSFPVFMCSIIFFSFIFSAMPWSMWLMGVHCWALKNKGPSESCKASQKYYNSVCHKLWLSNCATSVIRLRGAFLSHLHMR